MTDLIKWMKAINKIKKHEVSSGYMYVNLIMTKQVIMSFLNCQCCIEEFS